MRFQRLHPLSAAAAVSLSPRLTVRSDRRAARRNSETHRIEDEHNHVRRRPRGDVCHFPNKRLGNGSDDLTRGVDGSNLSMLSEETRREQRELARDALI